MGTVFGICGALVTAASGAGVYWMDHEYGPIVYDQRYVLIADSLQGQLFDKQFQIKRLELKANKTDEEKALLEFLRLQEQQIKKQLSK